MLPLDGIARLEALLTREQIVHTATGDELHGRGEDWRAVWEMFCELAREPADEEFARGAERLRVGDDGDYDLLLHESGPGGRDADRFFVCLTRQFTFEDGRGEYAGMNALRLTIECDALPDGRTPKAHRWGYAGRRRDDVSDDAHPEIGAWAGYVDTWKKSAEHSNSFKVLDLLQPARWHAVQTDT